MADAPDPDPNPADDDADRDVAKQIGNALHDEDSDTLAGVAAHCLARAGYWRGRCEGQAEAITQLRLRVAELEVRERHLLYDDGRDDDDA